MFTQFLFQSMPFWASALCGLLLIATIVEPILVVRTLIGPINSIGNASGDEKRAKRVVPGLILRQALAALILVGMIIAEALGHPPPVVLGIAAALLWANTTWKFLVHEVRSSPSSSATAQAPLHKLDPMLRDLEPVAGNPLVEPTEVRPARSGFAIPPAPPGVHQHLVTDRPPLTALNKVYSSLNKNLSSLNKVYSSPLEAMLAKAGAPEDCVVCTVFAPPTVARDEAFLVQVFAHLSEAVDEAAALAVEFDPTATRRVFQSLETRIARGTRLTFELNMRGAVIDDPVARLVWNGRTEAVQFGVSVSSTAKPGAIIGTLTVSQDSVPVGHLKFKLQVVSEPEARRNAEPVGDSARRYRTAFVSYASQDRDKVLARVQMLRPLGIQYFQDILDLEPGTRWERELYRRIDECDLFLLFWSQSAKQSPWVLKEARYALARKGDDEFHPPEVMPVILEGPPIPLPPPDLEHLHFNDRLIYFMSGSSS